MKHSLLTASLASLLLLSSQSYGQTIKEQVNYLSIPGPSNVQKKVYQLSWSSHPDASLYKQEYFAVRDHFPNDKSMVMIDFVLAATTVDAFLIKLKTDKATLVKEVAQFSLPEISLPKS